MNDQLKDLSMIIAFFIGAYFIATNAVITILCAWYIGLRMGEGSQKIQQSRERAQAADERRKAHDDEDCCF